MMQEPYGDRRQELVFIGNDMNEAGLRRSLDAALLSDDEVAAGLKFWLSLDNPLVAQEEL